MADTKLTGLTELTAPALGDWLYAVDVSDTTDDAAGSSRKLLNSTLLQYVPHGLTEISVTGATTATIGRMHVCSGTTADYELTLPAASGNTGKIISVRMATGLTKLVTIDGNASETIDGSLTRIMWAGESAILLCDGSNWFKIGGKSIPLLCAMKLNSTQASLVDATWYRVNIDAVIFDPTGLMADATNKQIKLLRPSKYSVQCLMYSASGSNIGLYTVVGAFMNPSAPGTASEAVLGIGTGNYTAYTPAGASAGGIIISTATTDILELHAFTDGYGSGFTWQLDPSKANSLYVSEIPQW